MTIQKKAKAFTYPANAFEPMDAPNHCGPASGMFVVRQFETDQAFREERRWLIRVRV
jgi:hypothetical protein